MTVKARDDVTLANVNDVTASVRYYQLKASTASAPTAPTVYPAPSPWVTVEPSYSDGATNSLYTVDVTVFSDGSFDYSTVSLSSSYEAAKAAWNKAQAAQTSATSAQTSANIALANAQELVVNGGFETGDLTGWTASGVVVLGVDHDPPHSGNYQARFSAGASCSQSINGLVSGHVVRCSFWQRGYDGRTATMTISFNGGDEQIVGSISGVTPYTSAFKDFTVPANTTMATIKLTCDTDYIRFDDVSVKDITEANTAQKAADDAQATADAANIVAKNAASIANEAQAAAQGAQTTADGKNKIFSSASEPSHTGIIPGDMWFQLDANNNVSGIKVWDGSAFTDMVLLANQLLVASSVGTTQIADNAIVTGKIAANAITAIKLAAQSITGDKLDVGSVASAIVTSGKFQTSNGRMLINDDGLTAKDANGNTTVNIPSDGSTPTMVGGLSTSTNGKHISISQSGDVGKLSLLNDNTELTSLTFIDDTANSGYVYTGLYTGQNGQFLQFATLVDSVNHHPDPLTYAASFTSNGRMVIDASYGINVNGTWFARSVDELPTAPNVVGGYGTMAVVGGVDYVFDGTGLWVQQTQLVWTVCDTALAYYTPTASGTVQALSVRKQHGIVELMGRIAVNGTAGGTVQQNSDMGAMIPAAYRPTVDTMIQSDQTSWGHIGPPFYVKPDGHIIWGPSMSNATDAIFHGMWVCA